MGQPWEPGATWPYNAPPQPSTQGSAIRPNPVTDVVTNTFPGMEGAGGAAVTPQPMQQHDPNAYPPVGSANYDQYVVNDMLKDNGMNYWQMAGQAPTEIIEWKIDPSNVDAPPIRVPTGVYVINALDPRTKQVRQIKLAKVWRLPNGQITTTEQKGEGYGFQATQISDQIAADPTKVGHSNQMTIGDTIFGTSNATGNFEEVPGSKGKIPKEVLKWGSLQQIQEPDGTLSWYGIDPGDGQPKRIETMPKIPKEATAWGNPNQIESGGKLVWYGVDPVTKQLGPIPGMPVNDKPPTGPGSITQAGRVYVPKAGGGYEPAPGIPDPNPAIGATHLELGSDGFIVQLKHLGGGRFEPDLTFQPVPFSDAAKQGREATGAMHQKGERGEKVQNGMVYQVIYRGGGDDNFDFDTSVPAKPYPGTQQSILQATTNDQEFLVYRDPQDPTKQIKVINPNYAPTDPSARRRLLSQQANTKFEEFQARVKAGTGYTGEQAQKDFDVWWNDNIAPESADIDRAQQKADAEQQKRLQDMRVAGQTAATAARAQAVAEYNASSGEEFSPDFAKALSLQAQGKPLEGIDTAKLFVGSGLKDRAEKAAAEALKNVDPTAAAIVGGPPPTWQNTPPAQAIDRSRYTFGGPTPAPAPVTPGAPAPVQPAAPFDWGASATPIMTTPEGQTQFQYPFVPPDPEYQAQQAAFEAQQAADLEAMMAQMNRPAVAAYQPPPYVAPVRRRSMTALAPATPAPAPAPFYQQALAAGLGAGGLGPENYVPPQYQYGGMYPTQQPW